MLVFVLVVTAAAAPSPAPSAADVGSASSAPAGFAERAVRFERRDLAWWELATAEGELRFTGRSGAALSTERALLAVGEKELARKQAVAGFLEQILPFSLAFPLLGGPIAGLAAFGAVPSLSGGSFVEVVRIGWQGAVLGGVIGVLAAVALYAFGVAGVQLVRPATVDVIRAVRGHNVRVAEQLGVSLDALPPGYITPLE